jgi:hypothetical protein
MNSGSLSGAGEGLRSIDTFSGGADTVLLATTRLQLGTLDQSAWGFVGFQTGHQALFMYDVVDFPSRPVFVAGVTNPNANDLRAITDVPPDFDPRQWHTYGIAYGETSLSFFIDEKLVLSMATGLHPDAAMTFIIDDSSRGTSHTLVVDRVDVITAPVPEPGTFALIAVVVVPVLGRRRLSRSASC